MEMTHWPPGTACQCSSFRPTSAILS